ncbi:MAG: carbamoyltransferase [Candidatus Omnitrophica bacterium]|nr:carbamoyltransferase [Candidatus Omnitrophota bacterium]
MKPTYILGISAFYHDSAAAILRDGEIVAAAQEERFTRRKHDAGFPICAINYCLKEAGIESGRLDYTGFYDKPLIKFERILETALSYAPRGIKTFYQAMPLWLKQKIWIPEIIKKETGYNGKILFAGHHESHAASAFYPSPFSTAAVLTMDGVGEWGTASIGIGEGDRVNLQYEIDFPHSLGLLYSAFTYYTGFKVNSGEYKLMGLAPYGEPKYADLILKELIDLKEDGSFKLNMEYFGYCDQLKMVNRRFERLFGGPARKPETKITQAHMDLARSIQVVTEEVMLRAAKYALKVTGKSKLCLAGGVALNCVGNGRILREAGLEDLWIQPASGDAGGALGVALLIWHKVLGNKRLCDERHDSQKGSFLGPRFRDEEIEEFLKEEGAPYHKFNSDEELARGVAALLAGGSVIGWFQHRMEFGPRALGARSIIGDARSAEMQFRMNLKIKFRESFRPFAPTVLREKAADYFEFEGESPYMLLVADVKSDKLLPIEDSRRGPRGFDKLKVKRSVIPAVTHVDNSARIQTITREHNPLYYDLINEFYKLTGCPVVINTSFNVRGEPIVCTPKDAFTCFMRTDMDYLSIGRFLLHKKEQKPVEHDSRWQKEFELD